MVDRDVCDGRDEAAAQDDDLSADAVREPPEHEEERCSEGHRPQHDRVCLLERELEVRAHEEVRLELALVPDHTLTRREADQDEQDRADLAAAEAFRSPVARAGDHFLLLLEAREERRLTETDADEERDHHEDGRYPERIAPALRREIRGGHRVAEVQDDREREEEAECRGRLDPRGVQTTFVVGRVLGDVNRRPAVLAAKRQALDDPEEH